MEAHEMVNDAGVWEQRVRRFFSSGFLDQGLFTSKVIDLLAGTSTLTHPSHGTESVYQLGLEDYLNSARVIGESIQASSPGDITTGSSPTIVVISGSPCYSCVRKLGQTRGVGPALLLDHLSLPGSFKLTALPQSSWPIVTIRLVTVGTSSSSTNDSVDTLQEHADRATKAYSTHLLGGQTPGMEQCRRVNIHSKHLFSVEQQVSILVQPTSQNPCWSTILFSDSGQKNPQAPWKKDRGNESLVQFFPLIRHGHCSLDAIKIPGPYRDRRDTRNFDNPDPCTSRADNDDRKLSLKEKEAALQDPLVLVCDLFSTSILSWLQLFSFIRALHDVRHNKEDSMSCLLNDKALVDRSQQHVRDMVKFLETRAELKWPKSVGDGCTVVNHLVKQVQEDLYFLMEERVNLSTMLEGLIQLELHADSKKETQAALLQGEQVRRLTILGFGFLPASLVSSCFGMNVDTFESPPSLKYYFIFAAPITVLCLLFLKLNWFIGKSKELVGKMRSWMA